MAPPFGTSSKVLFSFLCSLSTATEQGYSQFYLFICWAFHYSLKICFVIGGVDLSCLIFVVYIFIAENELETTEFCIFIVIIIVNYLDHMSWKYVSIVKQIIKNCCYTYSQYIKHLTSSVTYFFHLDYLRVKLGLHWQDIHPEVISGGLISSKNLKMYHN